MTISRLILAMLLAFGLPLAAASAAPPDIEIYGRLPGFEMASLSPSGDRIALIGVVQDRRRLLVLGRDKTPLAAMDVGDNKIRSIDWAGEELVLVRASKTVELGIGFTADKTELTTMIVVPVSGKTQPWNVFANNSNITGGIRGFFGAIERGGRWYGYFGGITLDSRGFDKQLMSTRPELYEVDLETKRARLIARRSDADNIRRDWVIGPDGTVAASLDFNSTGGSWTIRNREGRTLATGKAPTGDIALLSLGRTPDTAFYYFREDSGVDRLFEVPLAGGEPVEVLEDKGISSYQIDSRSRQLIGYRSDGDYPEDHYFDPKRERVATAMRKAFPDVSMRVVDANDAFDRLIVQTSGIRAPESWFAVDIKTGTAEEIGYGYTLRDSEVAPMRMFAWKAADGLAMSGVLTTPPGRDAKKLPLIVLPHGGPASRDHPDFDWWAQAYASRGYAVFQPNFRGSSGISESFLRAGYGEWGRKMQSDISDGVAALAAEGIVDPKRACIVGASYGGYAALAGVTLQQGLYRCAVSVAGVADVYRMASTDIYESGDDPTTIRALRAEVGRGRDLKQVSPVTFVARADAPILLIHGVDDIVVPFAQSRVMASALDRAGKPYELVTLPGEDHWLSRSETRLTMLKASLAFIEKHNPADAAPEKP